MKPNDLADLQRVGGIPFVVASLLALLAAATLAHTLVTSVRRRRRDLSILKTLGSVRTQLSRAVAWQASAFAVVALAVGLPLGIAAGRWVWAVFAGRLGVPDDIARVALFCASDLSMLMTGATIVVDAGAIAN